jgi:hypothetical protein
VIREKAQRGGFDLRRVVHDEKAEVIYKKMHKRDDDNRCNTYHDTAVCDPLDPASLLGCRCPLLQHSLDLGQRELSEAGSGRERRGKGGFSIDW